MFPFPPLFSTLSLCSQLLIPGLLEAGIPHFCTLASHWTPVGLEALHRCSLDNCSSRWMHYTAVGATLAVSHTYGRGHGPPCPSQVCLCHCIAVVFLPCSPFLAACAPCVSLLLYPSSRCMQLASIHLSPWLGRGPTSLVPHHCWGVVVLQPRSSSPPNHQHCKTGAGDELQVLDHYKFPVRDVHRCALSACKSCSRCLCLFGQQHELCSVLKSPSFSRPSSMTSDWLY